jgi:type II pantothenate kinase
MGAAHNHSLKGAVLSLAGLLPEGVIGIDAGMTMTKVARAAPRGIEVSAIETASLNEASLLGLRADAEVLGLTGARSELLTAQGRALSVPEIDAAAGGCVALLKAEDRTGDGEFMMALLGTGTAFAAVRPGSVAHLGGTALGGGSFTGIAHRVAPELSYDGAIGAAFAGDRRTVDMMISDVYPEGLGRIGPDLTAAHVARTGDGSTADFLAGLLNLHAESIAMIAAGRARMANCTRIVLCGGFVHNNARLVEGISAMGARFGNSVETIPAPGFAGAIGAALLAANTTA